MRPLGVTLVGFYQILRGALSLVFGLSVCSSPDWLQTRFSRREGNAVERLLRDFGHIAGLGIVVFAVVHMLAGYGVLQCKTGDDSSRSCFPPLASCWFSPASSTATCFRCSSEPSTRPASSIWPCPRSSAPSMPKATDAHGRLNRSSQYSVLSGRSSLRIENRELRTKLSTMIPCQTPPRSKKFSITFASTNIPCSLFPPAKITERSRF